MSYKALASMKAKLEIMQLETMTAEEINDILCDMKSDLVAKDAQIKKFSEALKEVQGELSDLEKDYKTEFNTAEDLRCAIEDRDAQIKRLTERVKWLHEKLIVEGKRYELSSSRTATDELLAEING